MVGPTTTQAPGNTIVGVLPLCDMAFGTQHPVIRREGSCHYMIQRQVYIFGKFVQEHLFLETLIKNIKNSLIFSVLRSQLQFDTYFKDVLDHLIFPSNVVIKLLSLFFASFSHLLAENSFPPFFHRRTSFPPFFHRGQRWVHGFGFNADCSILRSYSLFFRNRSKQDLTVGQYDWFYYLCIYM